MITTKFDTTRLHPIALLHAADPARDSKRPEMIGVYDFLAFVCQRLEDAHSYTESSEREQMSVTMLQYELKSER